MMVRKVYNLIYILRYVKIPKALNMMAYPIVADRDFTIEESF